jgi:putative N6-adenine-specific DNA methylase
LHKRGYREDKGDVPLRENIAAALVLLSFWSKDRLLVDPMCGSGTILIEAARIARHIAPGLDRYFTSEQWSTISKSAWAEVRQAARAAVVPAGGMQIQGFDIEPDRIKDAKANARRAGVGADITFEVKDIKELWIDKQYGIVITNPPWGVKLGGLKELTPLYLIIHQIFKNKTGWSLYVLTADDRFPDFFKRAKPDRVRKLYNGTIQVNYYQYHGERPQGTCSFAS